MKQKSIKRDIQVFLDYMWDSERCDYFQCEPKNRSRHIFKTMVRIKTTLESTVEAKKKVKNQLLRYF